MRPTYIRHSCITCVSLYVLNALKFPLYFTLACRCPTGVCNEVTGDCECPQNVVGNQCDQCAVATYGYDPLAGCVVINSLSNYFAL